MTAPKNTCLIFTGGTIAMVRDGDALRPMESPMDFLRELPELAQLDQFFDERPRLAGHRHLFNIDSSNMAPHHWQQIARAVYEELDNYDGFVITHGTDTMAYTASALAYMLRGLNKPVVLTGSQVPLTGHFVIDARNNLFNAFRAAAMGAEKHLNEVVIMFGSKLLRGTRAVKHSVFDFEAFTSFNAPPLGNVGLRFQLNEREFLRHSARTPVLQDAMESNVALLKLTPGMPPAVMDAIVDSGVKGLVIEAFGTGNMPNVGEHSLLPSVQRALEKGVIVVVATQAQVGAADLFYLTGVDFIRAGAISAYDTNPGAATVKLMWLLGQHGTDYEAIRQGMHTNFAGEIDVNLVRALSDKAGARKHDIHDSN